MLEQWWRGQLRSQGLIWHILLRPLALAYGLGLRLVGLSRPVQPPQRLARARVVSVGNVSVGGTGKTPLGLALAKRLASRNKVAVVLRGYKGRPTQLPLLVSRGQGALVGVVESGDEAQLYAALPKVAVVVDPDRLRGARYAEASLGAQVVILDDGFQRRWQLARDLDIVALDHSQLFEPWLLPKGPYREPLSAAAAADVLVLTRAPKKSSVGQLKRDLPAVLRSQPLFACRHEPVGLRTWPGAKRLGLRALRGKCVAALSGIGQPESFEESLRSLGCEVLPLRSADHATFSPEQLQRSMDGLQVDAIVTTSKDAVRLPQDWQASLPVWVLEMELKFSQAGSLNAILKRAKRL